MSPSKIPVPYPPPSPLPPSLRKNIIGALFSQTDAIPSLQRVLLSECEKAGWLDAVRLRSLQLLREDGGRTHDELLAILTDEARGQGEMVQNTGEAIQPTKLNNTAPERINIKMPKEAVKEGTKVVTQALNGVVKFEDSSW